MHPGHGRLHGRPWRPELPLRRGRNVITVGVKRESGLGVSGGTLAAIVRVGGRRGRRLTTPRAGRYARRAGRVEKPDFDDGLGRRRTSARKPSRAGPLIPRSCCGAIFGIAARSIGAALRDRARRLRSSINGCAGRGRADGAAIPIRRAASLYQAYDVTAMISTGANAIGLWHRRRLVWQRT